MFALSMSPSQVVAFERQNEIDAAEAGAGRRGDGGRATKPPGHLGDGLAHDFFSNLCDAWRRDWRWDGRAPDSDYEMCADALFMLRAVAAAVLKRAGYSTHQVQSTLHSTFAYIVHFGLLDRSSAGETQISKECRFKPPL